MSLLTNAVVLSVLVMAVLCVLRLNVLLSIIIAALVAGWLSPLPLESLSSGADSQTSLWQYFLLKTTATGEIFTKGMASNLNIALSYILLGGIAVAISRTHLMTFLLSAIANVISNRKFIFILSIALIACFSQNLVPIHIAFIPILIPPLLSLMNRLKIDRRAVACALTFGLQAPYVTLGVGFGLIFHTTISEQMKANGMPVSLSEISSVMWIGGAAMLLGLLFAVFVLYAKPREYAQKEECSMGDASMGWREYATLFGIIMLFVVQLVTHSLAIGAFAGLMCMIVLRGVRWSEIDSVMEGGLKMMAFIAFVMLVAAGYGEVLRASGEVQNLVQVVANFTHQVGDGAMNTIASNGLDSNATMASNPATLDSNGASLWAKFIGASLMLLVGLLITIGIGTSFGTIPIIAAIYVPFGISLGFSVPAIILLIGIAGALGDAGSPASDSTLGPTSGLNMDGQHNHIYDTCIPTFFVYNIPLLVAGTLGAMMF
ncbi:sodium:proton antiporter [Helicobacter cinaedi]|uniref:Na+/H+ antiporter n=1 Tax=Helicobacter cinaedi CCUG 18818 = ATCC BAA-847 TaxID=537971 RepID=A0AAI8QH12_9HELI|nr:Na+/H+ antiporter NhaC family protein [Helicobacter cinaedi]EFR46852.1 Na+/H+ antiporter family protein [Helicobacter cinaedi CCUG 18818 = ATCC BAA-847]QOQ91630.1 sodium:proton antiporter [Helicobacter cinaedi]BAM32309.1 putative Na+/H+ antiporter [Helicobacter cinaedi CCUG 18818 = ATCC BAA-847]